MLIRTARETDIPILTALINRSYRGESSRAGWTTEADLLSGLRIDENGLLDLINDSKSLIFIAIQNNRIVASIHARHESDGIHFGLFAVEPILQGNGIGKKLLESAEMSSMKAWGIDTAFMEVITLRTELIVFYEHLGYVRTGEIVPFPSSELWERSVPHLEMAVLKKKTVTIKKIFFD